MFIVQIFHWRASSLLFMPNGCNVLLDEPVELFLLSHVCYGMSSIGIRRTSLIEWPAWLKWSDTGVVVLRCWWFRIERRCSPKPSLSKRLVSPMYWGWHLLHSIKYMRFLKWQDMESVIFLASLTVKKFSLFDLHQKRTGKAAWVDSLLFRFLFYFWSYPPSLFCILKFLLIQVY